MMNVLITAGGTRENIDSVRSISNHATGRLGSIIADVFAQANSKVTYVCGEAAVLPAYTDIEIIRIRSVAELIETMETLLHQRPYDCVIHSMAVSDFTPQAIIAIDEMAETISHSLQGEDASQNELSDKIRAAIFQCVKPLTDKKISSNASDVMLLLKQTPKVIERIKAIQPHTLLVGFKLLSNVSEKELLLAGQNLLTKNTCDFVLANDLANIENDRHKAILMDNTGILRRANTKQEIARMIFECVSERTALPKEGRT